MWSRFIAILSQSMPIGVCRKYPVCQTHLKKLKAADLSQESKDSETAAMTEYISSNRPWGQGSYPSKGYVSPVSGCTLHFGNVSTLHPDSAALDSRLREMAEVLGVQDYASTPVRVSSTGYIDKVKGMVYEIDGLESMSMADLMGCTQLHQLAGKVASDIQSGAVNHREFAGEILSSLVGPLREFLPKEDCDSIVSILEKVRDGEAVSAEEVIPLMNKFQEAGLVPGVL
ncbi:hypothetical protein [Lumpfish ranavirus]|uniref:Dpy-19-like protein n=1 Tax=Lumpfish ranavirus TaxID=2501771 RepID=A0A3Q9T897_9VIRU|nr:hypothetical protein [Lumpfish ranavirus]